MKMLYCAAKFKESESDFQLSGLVSGVPTNFIRFFRLLRSPVGFCRGFSETSAPFVTNDDSTNPGPPGPPKSSSAKAPFPPASHNVTRVKQTSARQSMPPASHAVFAKAQRMFGPASSTAALASLWYLGVLLALLVVCKVTFPALKVLVFTSLSMNNHCDLRVTTVMACLSCLSNPTT